MLLRPYIPEDLHDVARIRATDWGTQEYWEKRINAYINLRQSPQSAKESRAIWVAIEEHETIGMIAGHLTNRFGCQGELQWVHVRHDLRGKQIAHRLFGKLTSWFISVNAFKICVNVEPDNISAIRFYEKQGAHPIRRQTHWMIWDDIRVNA